MIGTEDFSASVIEITVVGIVVIVIVGHHSDCPRLRLCKIFPQTDSLLSGARMLPVAPPPATACNYPWKTKSTKSTTPRVSFACVHTSLSLCPSTPRPLLQIAGTHAALRMCPTRDRPAAQRAL